MIRHRLLFLISCASLLLGACASIDHSERNVLTQRNVSPVVYDKMVHGQVLTVNDVIELSQRDVPPLTIIRYLRSTRAYYELDKQDMAHLRQANVSQEVLDYLVSTPSMFAPRTQFYYGAAYPSCYYGGPAYPDCYYPYPSFYPYFFLPPFAIICGGHWWHR